MWSGRVLLCALCIMFGCARAEDWREVRTAQGPVRGHRAPEGDLFVFYNIPYATAPTGRDKFKAPLPAPIWISTRDAVDEGVICPQAAANIGVAVNKTIKEDCLIANIYVPDTEQTNLPVVVMVHGGAYQIGYGDMITPKYLVRSKKIIVVNFNYRLGPHGFLCLGTPDAPGNAGMKDQVALLRWVKKNIASFGGNSEDVTIQGFSAGSSAVDLLLLSKSARGLFNKVIPESGANVGVWSVQIDPIANAQEFAMEEIENVNDIYVLEEFYRNAPSEVLFKDSFLLRDDNNFLFVPCVERDTGVERFLTDNPVNILKKGDFAKVPLLYGFANMEGLFRVNYGYEKFRDGMNKRFSDFLPLDLQFENEEEKQEVAKQVKEFYFGDKDIGEDTIMGFIDYYTDIMFAYPTLRSVKLQVEAGNDQIYLYQFEYPQEQPMPAGFTTKIEGANHCAQSMTVLDGILMGSSDETNLPDDMKKIKTSTREYWLNFMTTGSPWAAGSELPAWPAAGVDRAPYMSLTLPPRLQGELLPQRARFWDDIYDKYYRAPSPPPNPPKRHSEL